MMSKLLGHLIRVQSKVAHFYIVFHTAFREVGLGGQNWGGDVLVKMDTILRMVIALLTDLDYQRLPLCSLLLVPCVWLWREFWAVSLRQTNRSCNYRPFWYIHWTSLVSQDRKLGLLMNKNELICECQQLDLKWCT